MWFITLRWLTSLLSSVALFIIFAPFSPSVLLISPSLILRFFLIIIVFHHHLSFLPCCRSQMFSLFSPSLSSICLLNDRGWLSLHGVFIVLGVCVCVCVCACRRYSANSPSLPDRLMTSLCFTLSLCLCLSICLSLSLSLSTLLLEIMSSIAPSPKDYIYYHKFSLVLVFFLLSSLSSLSVACPSPCLFPSFLWLLKTQQSACVSVDVSVCVWAYNGVVILVWTEFAGFPLSPSVLSS